MAERFFGKHWRLAAALVVMACLIGGDALAQKPKVIAPGAVLTGELNVMRVRIKGKAGRVNTYHLVSTPRRLAGPGGMCNLETGPETFQIVAHSDEEADALMAARGKTISIRVKDVSCAREAGQYSDAVVSKWSLVN